MFHEAALLNALLSKPGEITMSAEPVTFPIVLAPDVKAPVLGLYGGADAGIPVSEVEAFKAALAKAHKSAEFKIYPGAPLGCHADCRASYRKDAAEDAWRRMQAWFQQYKVLG